jgi:quercetin dioxygenase-like cupin family protein
MAVIVAVCPLTAAANDAGQPPGGRLTELMARDLAGAAGKEVRVVTVDYAPGAASQPHRHNAQVFVYVLEGTVKMQVEGAAAVTLGPGETFYEGPDDIHTVSANASPTKAARILVFIVKDKGAALSNPITARQRP